MEIPLWERRGRPEFKVQAVMLTPDNTDEIANWTQAQVVMEQHPFEGENMEGLNVKTPGGKKRASQGDYIVHAAGSFHVVARGSFELQYNPVVILEEDGPKPVSTKRVFSDPFEKIDRV